VSEIEVKAAVDAVVQAASAQRVDGYSDEFRDALNQLVELPSTDRPRLGELLTQALPNIEAPIGAGLLAVWFGSGVENGADPDATTIPILRTMIQWTQKIITAPEDSEKDDPEPDEEILTGVQFLGQALVAHLGHSRPLRDKVAAKPDVLKEFERVSHLAVGATWVAELLLQQSGELLVLHGEHPIGVRVRYENLTNCFHLFTLIQGELAAIMPDAETPQPDVLAVARGESFDKVHDVAWWHFGPGNCSKADAKSSVWGEARLDSIPSIDGVQVMILWPKVLESRGWSGTFFGPYLQASPPSVSLQNQLSDDEVAEWRERIGLLGGTP
jgi:hypothetical protein